MDTTSLRTIMNYLASDLEYLPIFAAVLNAAMAPLLNLFESLGPRNPGDRSPLAALSLDPKKWRYQSGDITSHPSDGAEFDVNLEQGHDGFVRLKDCR